VGDNCEADGVGVERLCITASADTAAVLATGVLCDQGLSAVGAPRIEVSDTSGEASDVVLIQFRSTLRRLLPSCRTGRGICGALLLGLVEGVLFNE
jgi:hypothetical protein